MKDYEERAKKFVEQIFPFIENESNIWAIRNSIAIFNMKFNRKVLVKNGIARVALITSDYVIKFDYNEYEVESVGGCEQEIKLYKQAEQDGMEYLFAKITRYVYNGRYFYIMPRIRGIRDSWNHADYYMTEEELNWCDQHDLSDLHSNNYGFRNGHLCIVDYACNFHRDGFEEESENSYSWSH